MSLPEIVAIPADPQSADSLWDSLVTYRATPLPPDYDSGIRIFYSPGDRCHEVLKAFVQSAKESLYVSMYGEDDPELTDLIIAKAEDPDVFVQINLDKTQAAGNAEKALVVKLRSCPKTLVAVGMSIDHKINHLKIVVVDKLYRLGGSMNWSADGEGVNGHGQNNELCAIRSVRIALETIDKLNRDHQVMLAQEARAATSA